jgi:multidrug efflux system membrane fusion protein
VARDRALLSQAQANLGRDQAQSKSADVEAKRYEQLAKEGMAPQMQSDQQKATADAAREAVRADQAGIESARASLEADQAAVARAKLDLSYCEIRSPVAGRAGNLLVHPGNLIKVNDAALVVINQVEPIFISFGVPEEQLAAIKQKEAREKLEVQAFSDHDPGHIARGVLTVIDNAVYTNTGTIKLKARFDNHERLLWPGEFVNVVLTLDTQNNATVVPSEAVQDGQHGQFIFVVKADQTVEPRVVTVSRTLGSKAVIGKGIAPGETVVTDGQLRLFPGAKIQPVPAGKVDNQAL